MPNVLWEMQGYQKAIFSEHEIKNGGGIELAFEQFQSITEGNMSDEDFQTFVRDTVNFLDYMSEPAQLRRKAIGVWVLMFLSVFLVLTIMLKKEVWKDVS
jgi:ubiquinol-cytochrome c reductase cytochrome c1 subunit